jgi:methyl-accepting chemotaxis protein
LTTSQITHLPTVVFAYPVRREDDSSVGVKSFGINLLQTQTLFAGASMPEGAVISLIDRSGLVMARSTEPDRFIGTTADVPSADSGNAPAMTPRTDADGVERIFASAPIDRQGWTIGVGIPTSVVVAQLLPFWRRNVAIASIAVFGSLLWALWMSTQVSRQLRHLRAAAVRIANGDLSPPGRLRVGNLETAQLQDAFVAMAESLRAARAALDRQVEHEREIRKTVQAVERQVVSTSSTTVPA